jgi:hypothetical protein
MLIAVGFASFLALLYFIGAGDTGGPGEDDGRAHAAARGLNGYAGLVRLLEAEGYEADLSRSPEGLKTRELLVIAPPLYANAEEVAGILEQRANLGPTLLILPKWRASVPPPALRRQMPAFEDGWVRLGNPVAIDIGENLPEPFRFTSELATLDEGRNAPAWRGFGLAGSLPTGTAHRAAPSPGFEPLIIDSSGGMLAFSVLGEPETDFYEDAHWTVIVTEPDLLNNYGLADPTRAAAALAIIRETGFSGADRVVFDLTLNGFSGAQNLLSLAFQPPFVAATICLVLALMIVAWRAFMRFGAVATAAPEIAYGKERLVRNGAGLVVRAKRMRLLAEPYAALVQRRIVRLLGLPCADASTIDDAIAERLPGEQPFTARAAALRDARSPNEILRAARALDSLARKLAT